MSNPSISDYIRTLDNPYGVFRTLGEIGVERDVYGEIELRAGNSAAVFTYRVDGVRRFLKCYIRPNPHLREIYGYVELNRPTLLSGARLLRDELYVHTLSDEEGWVDIVEGEWVEGGTLDVVIARAAKDGDKEGVERLADVFDSLCRELLAQEWAHGDLKPENIVVRPDGSMTLIDCDAMWIPDFAGQTAAELGTPAYRHPGCDASYFNKHIDDYPALLISASLHALALDPQLYSKYNTTDNIIFSPPELVAGDSPAFAEVAELFAINGKARELRVLEACCLPFPEVDNVERYFRKPPVFLSGELVSFPENGKWGFASLEGNTAISAFWDEVLDFRNGRAAVRLGRWWHFADTTGRVSEAGLSTESMTQKRK